MIKPRILVTGATGKTGSVVTDLLRAGYPVRALVHREDGRRERLEGQGAEIAVAELCVVVAPLSPGFNLKRYDRELRGPFSSEPQFAPRMPR